MNASTKLLALALPVATLITLLVLLTSAALPQVGATPDLIAYALELAPRTMYALAIGGSSAVAMRITGMNLDNSHRTDLIRQAADGKVGAVVVLTGETLAWFGWAVLWSVVYL